MSFNLRTVKCLEGRIDFNINQPSAPEYMHVLSEREDFNQYFRTIINHGHGHTLEPNCFFVYCRPLSEFRVKVINELRYEDLYKDLPDFIRGASSCTSDEDLHHKLIGPYAYREARHFPREIKIDTNSNLRTFFATKIILYEDTCIGYYLHALESGDVANIFWLSDVTHNPNGAQVFYHCIWPRLKEDLCLEPVGKQKEERERQRVPVRIGVDPEFEALKGGRVACASDFVNGGTRSPIGVDGAGGQVELRPAPGKPHEVVRSLRNLFKEFNDTYEAPLTTRGARYPLGGHIHFGLGHRWSPHTLLVRMLDDFLGAPLLDLSGPARGSYRNLSSWEQKPWGFEYRSLPAAVFLKPSITRIVLKIAYRLADTYINGSEISYNSPPRKEDYMRVVGLTEKEFGRLTNFIQEYNQRYSTKRKIATAYWVKGAEVEMPVVEVIFRDDWHSSIKNNLRMLIEKLCKQELGDKEVPFCIVLYGLRQDRGEIATLEFGNYESVTQEDIGGLPHGMGRDGFWVGLPFTFRNEPTQYVENKESFIRAIIDEIRRCMD